MNEPSSTCVRFIANNTELTYSDDGEPMCVACRNRQDDDQRLRRIACRLCGLAYSSAATGVIAIPFAIVFVLGGLASTAALGTGLRARAMLATVHPDLLAIMGVQHRLARLSAWVGVVSGALGTLFLVVQVGSVLWSLANS